MAIPGEHAWRYPVKLTDEAELRRRLHEEIDLAQIAPVPEDAVFRRYRAGRAWRLAAITSGVAVIAAVLGVLAVGARPGPSRPVGLGTMPHGPHRPGRGGVFASGTANGRAWRLAAVNLADPGYRCLPGVVLDGQNGDLLQPGFLPGLTVGNAAFLAINPGRPGIGFAFLRLRPGVSEVTAHLGDGTRLRLRPLTVTVCGQRFRLAGFEYPRQGVTRIAARSAQGRPIGYTPLADYFSPASPFEAGTWVNVQGATGNVAAGDIGSGSIDGTSWRMQVTLGPDGECFTSQIGPAGPGFAASICAPVGASPKGASLDPLPYARPAGGVMIWYPAAVNARTAYLRARLSDGTIRRLTPVVVGGRKYAVLGIAERVRVTRLTLYDTHGHVLAVLTSFPHAH
jgi:hypothetical protein